MGIAQGTLVAYAREKPVGRLEFECRAKGVLVRLQHLHVLQDISQLGGKPAGDIVARIEAGVLLRIGPGERSYRGVSGSGTGCRIVDHTAVGEIDYLAPVVEVVEAVIGLKIHRVKKAIDQSRVD